MNSRQRKTLEAIFEKPTRADVRWADIISLLKALGASVDSGGGSHVGFALNKRRMVLPRPHPQTTAKKYVVEEVREFLRSMEVKP